MKRIQLEECLIDRTVLLAHALVGYQQEARRIDREMARIRAMLDHRRNGASPVAASIAAGVAMRTAAVDADIEASKYPARKRRRTLSPEGRARIAAAARRRWAEYHKTQRRARRGRG